MNELDPYERETLEYLLRTREDLTEVRRGDRAKALVSYTLGAALILTASYFLKSFGLARWVWIGAAAFGGVLIAYGAVHAPLLRQYEILHEYIDFDRVRARLD